MRWGCFCKFFRVWWEGLFVKWSTNVGSPMVGLDLKKAQEHRCLESTGYFALPPTQQIKYPLCMWMGYHIYLSIESAD
jgi:hypothetical protein